MWWCEVKRVTISLSEAASRLVGITLAVMRLVGNFVAVIGGCAAVIGDGVIYFL